MFWGRTVKDNSVYQSHKIAEYNSREQKGAR